MGAIESDAITESNEGNGIKPPTPIYNSRNLLSWIGGGKNKTNPFDGPSININ